MPTIETAAGPASSVPPTSAASRAGASPAAATKSAAGASARSRRRAGIGVVVAAHDSEAGAIGGGPQPGRVDALELAGDRRARAAAETVDELLGGQREELAQRALLAAGELDRAGQPRDQPRPPQAGVAGVGHAASPSARSWSWR